MTVFRSVTVQVKAKHGAIWKMVSRMIKTKVPGPVQSAKREHLQQLMLRAKKKNI